jgi:hypothetical protein
MRQFIGLALLFALGAFGSIAAAPAAQPPATSLAVLDMEITGDLGGPQLVDEVLRGRAIATCTIAMAAISTSDAGSARIASWSHGSIASAPSS